MIDLDIYGQFLIDRLSECLTDNQINFSLHFWLDPRKNQEIEYFGIQYI